MSAATHVETAKPVSGKDDDMHDVEKDLDAPFPLGAYLRLCDPCADTPNDQPCLRSDFDDADSNALDGQAASRKATLRAARFGLGALLVGLFQALFGRWIEGVHRELFVIEVLYTGYALYVVLRAIFAHRREEWLSERLKAEQLRLLKFKHLIDPTLWGREAKGLGKTPGLLETERRKIMNRSEDVLHALKTLDAVPELPRTADSQDVDVPALQRLLQYYQRKRLGFQRTYFEGKIRSPEKATENQALSPMFFFAGIACSMCFFVLELATGGRGTELADFMGHALVFLSFALPLGWSAIRTIKSAHQLARNRLRSHARYAALTEIETALSEETARPVEEWDQPLIFGYLYSCEGVLAADQYEWIRLMIEAEWYG